MILTSAKAVFGLITTAATTKAGSTGTVQLGESTRTVKLTTAVKAYALRAIFVSSGDNLVLTIRTNVTSSSTAFVAGTAQVTTATAAGSVSAGGNASVVVTAAGMTGSPKTLAVAVATSDTAAQWAAKVRTALAADTAVAAMFTVGGSTTAISLTRKPTSTFVTPEGDLNLYAANDGTLNIALATGTATGITTASTSAATTAGVVSDGVKIYGGDAKDFEGNALVALATVQGVYLEGEAVAISGSGSTEVISLAAGETLQRANLAGLSADTTYTFTPASAAAAALDIVVFGT